MTATSAQPRVLLVDDDAGMRALCAVSLRLAGLEVLEAENGSHGLERALAEQPDFVVLDVMMPGLDGFELAAQLRGDERTRGIPLLFLTGESDRRNKKRARALGALGYMAKPFDPAALVGLVVGAVQGAWEGDGRPLSYAPVVPSSGVPVGTT